MQSSLWSGSAHTLDNSHFPTQVINVKRGGIEFMETFLRYNHKTHLIEAYLSEEVILIIRGCTSANREKMFRIHSLTRQVILQCNVVIIRIIPSIQCDQNMACLCEQALLWFNTLRYYYLCQQQGYIRGSGMFLTHMHSMGCRT